VLIKLFYEHVVVVVVVVVVVPNTSLYSTRAKADVVISELGRAIDSAY
jgi:hypothetical protein